MLTRFEVEGFRNFYHRFTFNLTDVRDYRFNTTAIEGVSFPAVLSTVKTLSVKQISPMLFSIFQQMWGVGPSIPIKLITSALLMESRQRALLIRSALEMTKSSIVTKRLG